ncbi:hypothetical protein HDU90_008466 [Geranomyces variabilis]|nr:hypothetical protein HDU90_008466 [Geranomyces variabilis]
MADSGTDDEEGFVARNAGKKAYDSSREYDDLDNVEDITDTPAVLHLRRHLRLHATSGAAGVSAGRDGRWAMGDDTL